MWRSVGLMLFGTALMTGNDAITKLVTQTLPVGEVTFVRCGICTLLLLPLLVWQSSRKQIRMGPVHLQLARAILYAAATLFFLVALTVLPLSSVVAISFLSPIFVNLFAAVFLGETIGKFRWLAVLIGFLGVAIIVRPDTAVAGLGFALAIAAAFCDALKDVATRKLTASANTATTFTVTMAVTGLSGALYDFGAWQVPSSDLLWLMVLAGLMLAAANIMLIEAFLHGEASFVSTFKYSSIIWAMALDAAIWQLLPTAASLIGTGIILAAGWIALQSERRQGKTQ